MSLPAHDKLILLCARTVLDGDHQAQIRSLLAQGIQWAQVIARARQVEMTPLVYHHLKTLDDSLVPSGVRSQLVHGYAQNLSRNLLLSRELLSLTEVFQVQAIPFVPVKGVILAETVYRHLGLRQMCDLDVLIRRDDVQRAVRALTERGFRLRGHLPCTDAEFQQRRDVTLTKDLGRWSYPLELHWKFKDSFFRLPEKMLWDHLVDYAWNGKTVKIFSPELTLIHLIHHLNYHAFPLKILVDVAETMRAFRDRINWDVFWSLVRDWQLVRNATVALACVSAVLDVPLPEEARQGSCYLQARRQWVSSLVSHQRWYFNRWAWAIQARGRWRALFSLLLVDGGSADILRALLARLTPGGSETTSTGLRRTLGWRVANLISGLFRFVVSPRR